MLNLVESLPSESLFKSAMADRPPVSEVSSAVMDIWEALTGKRHPTWDAHKRAREEAEKKRIITEKRKLAEAHNVARRRFLEMQAAH